MHPSGTHIYFVFLILWDLLKSPGLVSLCRFQNLGEMMVLGRYDAAVTPSFIEGLSLEGLPGHTGTQTLTLSHLFFTNCVILWICDFDRLNCSKENSLLNEATNRWAPVESRDKLANENCTRVHCFHAGYPYQIAFWRVDNTSLYISYTFFPKINLIIMCWLFKKFYFHVIQFICICLCLSYLFHDMQLLLIAPKCFWDKLRCLFRRNKNL